MTKLLEKAIERARELPDDAQDALALTMLTMVDVDEPPEALDDETRAAIREGLAQAERGEFVPAEEIRALLRRFGA